MKCYKITRKDVNNEILRNTPPTCHRETSVLCWLKQSLRRGVCASPQGGLYSQSAARSDMLEFLPERNVRSGVELLAKTSTMEVAYEPKLNHYQPHLFDERAREEDIEKTQKPCISIFRG
ncbi:MAG: hypothetical protein ACNA8H_01085 [Anaerolineales bacterium]